MPLKETAELQTLFATHGLRCTRQRRALYAALQASDSHPTVYQLFQLARNGMPDISLATVYNTLEAFCSAGLTYKLLAAGGNGLNGANCVRYDITSHDHLHTRCSSTGNVHDVPDELGCKVLERIPQKLIRQIESKMGFEVQHVQIQLIGKTSEKPLGRT